MSRVRDSRDTKLNGIIAAVCVSFLSFFIMKGVSSILETYVLDDFNGFSEKLMGIISIVSILIPFQIFSKQERGLAMQGTVLVTFALLFILIYYFRAQFLA